MRIINTCLCNPHVNALPFYHNPFLIYLFSLYILYQHVDPVIISQKVIQGVYPGVTTSELDEYVIYMYIYIYI